MVVRGPPDLVAGAAHVGPVLAGARVSSLPLTTEAVGGADPRGRKLFPVAGNKPGTRGVAADRTLRVSADAHARRPDLTGS